MDIIEGLDLSGDLPEGFDFSLDDILEEYKTPSVPPAPEPEEDLFPAQTLQMESSQGDVLAGEVTSEPPHPEGDPFRLGDILEEFASRPAPSAPPPPEPEPQVTDAPPVHADVYEDDEGVKIYTPVNADASPQPPESPLSRRKGDAPTVKFRAIGNLLGKKKKQPAKNEPTQSLLSDEDVQTFTEAYTDTENEDGVYAAYNQEVEQAGVHDYMADFGLDSSSQEEKEEPDRPRRAKQTDGFSRAAAPIFTVLSSVKGKSVPQPEADEELGPEVDPKAATRHYGSHIETYRSRLHIAVILSIIMGWLSLGLPVAGALNNTGVCAAMCLILMLTTTLLGLDIFVAGFRSLLQKRPDAQSLVAVSCIASALDAVIIILTHGEQGYLPYCVVSGVSMCFAIYSAMLYCRGQRFNFRVLSLLRTPTTVMMEHGLAGNGDSVTRTAGYPDEYIHTSEEADLGETAYSMVTPFLLLAIPVLSLLAAFLSKSWGSFFHILAALYTAAAAFSALLAFPLPYFLVSRDLFRSGSAIAGWSGARALGTADSVIVTDKDLFPEDTISIESVRILEGVDPETAVSYVSSVVAASGSCLAPVFTELVRKNNCVLRHVEEFKCNEAGGLTAMIDGAEVLVGSSTFIKLMGIHLPQKLSSKNSVFLAINSKLVGIITITYKPTVSVQRGLAALLQGKADVIFAARDFNITPLLVSQKFKMPSESLNFPSFADRYRMTDPQSEHNGDAVAVVKRKTLFPFANVVSKARKLYSSVCMSVAFSVLSTFAGVILMFFLCCTGAFASASPGNLLLFMLLWLVPTIVFAIGMTK